MIHGQIKHATLICREEDMEKIKPLHGVVGESAGSDIYDGTAYKN